MFVSFIPKNTIDQEILAEVQSFEEAFQTIAEHCQKFNVRFKPEDITLEYEMPFGKYILDVQKGEKIPYALSKTRKKRR